MMTSKMNSTRIDPAELRGLATMTGAVHAGSVDATGIGLGQWDQDGETLMGVGSGIGWTSGLGAGCVLAGYGMPMGFGL